MKVKESQLLQRDRWFHGDEDPVSHWSMNEDIDISKEGRDIMIGFNPKFILDALRVIDDEEITMYLVNPKAPFIIKNDEQSYIYLVLPISFNM